MWAYIDILIHRLNSEQTPEACGTLYSLIETFVSFNLLAYTCSGMYCMTPDQWWGLGLFCWIYIFLYLWSKTFLFLSEVKAIFSLSFSRPYTHTHTQPLTQTLPHSHLNYTYTQIFCKKVTGKKVSEKNRKKTLVKKSQFSEVLGQNVPSFRFLGIFFLK